MFHPSPSPGHGAAPRRSPWARGARSPRRAPRGSVSGSPPTVPATSPRTGAGWSRRCGREPSPAWPPPRHWSLASTSAAWTPCSSPAGRGQGQRSGSRRAAPGGVAGVRGEGWGARGAALWQQAGRAGRDGRGAVAVLIARDDPLDTYLVHHPEALLRRPVEATVLDPGNPYVLAPHLCAAAAELPLTEADLALFGPESVAVTEALIRRGMLRRRGPRSE